MKFEVAIHRCWKIGMKISVGAVLLLLTACADDDASEKGGSDILQLVAYNQWRTDVSEVTTRAITYPSGFSEYKGPNSIGVYTMPIPTTSNPNPVLPTEVRTFTYNVENNKWNSLVSVKKDEEYCIYGYMPVNSDIMCSISMLDGKATYEDGAVMSFPSLPPVLAGDFSVVTGLLQLIPDSEGKPTETGNLSAGNFKYEGKQNGSNYVCLMLEHLYSCVRFKFKVDDVYSQLRTIKLTKVELKSENQLTYPLVVTFEAGKNCDVSWSTAGSYASGYAELLHAEVGKELLLPSVSDTDESHVVVVDGYFAPFDEIANYLVLKCTYDVYDKEGNLIRTGCEAENKLPANRIVAGPNQRTTLTLTVNPTYLYVLSDPDLDNPTVVIN